MKKVILLSIITSLNVMSMNEGPKRPREDDPEIASNIQRFKQQQLYLQQLCLQQQLLLSQQRQPMLTQLSRSVRELNITSQNINCFISCIREVLTLDLMNKNLTSLDGLGDIPGIENVSVLNLGHNELTEIPPSLFNLCPKLRTLYLNNNNIRAIDLKNVTKLEWLDLSYNKLTEIPPLPNNFSLKQLYLNNNIIKTINPNSLRDTRMLEQLRLNNNQLTEIPSLHLPFLKQLDLGYNFIKSIDGESFTGTPHLKVLSLAHNQLTKIPSLRLLNLTKLLLSYNHIDSIDGEPLKNTPHLLELNLSQNRVTHTLFTDNQRANIGGTYWLQSSNKSNPFRLKRDKSLINNTPSTTSNNKIRINLTSNSQKDLQEDQEAAILLLSLKNS